MVDLVGGTGPAGPITNFPYGTSSWGIPQLGDGGLTPTINFGPTPLWVDGSAALRGISGDGTSPTSPFSTMADAFEAVQSGGTIFFRGNIKEQLTTPAGVFDVAVIGCGNMPRNADSFTTPYAWSGSTGATWRQPDSATASTPLLTIQQQGWVLKNILFNAGPASTASVRLFRNAGAEGTLERDASHALITGCRFTGCVSAIEAHGGPNFVYILNNFITQSSAAAIMNTVGAGVGTDSYWQILGNIFQNNFAHIVVPMSYGAVLGNTFGRFTTTAGVNISGGTEGYNQVHNNSMTGDYDAGYVAHATDDWAGNWSMDVASAEVGAEAITIAIPVP